MGYKTEFKGGDRYSNGPKTKKLDTTVDGTDRAAVELMVLKGQL